MSDPASKLCSPGEWPESREVPYSSLLGTWYVQASTISMWKDKKNVSVTYSSPPNAPATTFEDVVSYNKLTDGLGAVPSTMKGGSKLDNGFKAQWKWRGRGLLMIASTRWQLLGYDFSPDQSNWMVTLVSQAMFAGVYIYAKEPSGLSEEKVKELMLELEGLGGQVEKLVKNGGMVRVPHDAP